jgi:hypothetical protein
VFTAAPEDEQDEEKGEGEDTPSPEAAAEPASVDGQQP